MTVVDIARLHARYHVVDASAVEAFEAAVPMLAAELDDVVGSTADRDVFAICIREIRLDVDLDPRTSHHSIARSWAAAIADALERHVAGDDGLVVYVRRADALGDVVRAVASGDDSRRWAWTQAGLVGPSDDLSGDLVADLLARYPADALVVIAADAALVVGVVAGPGWRRLARHVAGVVSGPVPVAHPPSPGPRPAARDVGAIWRAIAPLLPDGAVLSASRDELRSMVIVALAVVAPPRSRDGALIDALVERAKLGRHPGQGWIDPTADVVATEATVEARGRTALVDPMADGVGGDVEPIDVPDGSVDPVAGGRSVRPGERVDPTVAQPLAEADDESITDDPPAVTPLASRVGGTWFLVHGLTELDLPTVAAAALPDRRPGLILGRAVARVSAAPIGDPSIAAIVGETIDDLLADEPGEHDAPVVADLADRLGRWVRDRIGVDPDEDLDWLWRRAATLELEPAWIEVTFLAEDVDVRVRRVGLDLDPGFVWWRGAVVRFRYV